MMLIRKWCGKSFVLALTSMPLPALAVECSAIFPGPQSFTTNSVDSIEGGVSCNGSNCNPGSFTAAGSFPSGTTSNFRETSITAGTYKYNTWGLKENAKVTFSGTGTAVIYIKNNTVISKNTEINKGGDPANVILVINKKLKIEENAEINAFIYVYGSETTIEKDSKINGGIAARTKLILKENSTYTYTASDADNIDAPDFCDGGSSNAAVDHYAISHNSPGLTCEGSLVTITARDAGGAVMNVSAATSISLSTSPAVDSVLTSPGTILAGQSSTTFYLHQSSPIASVDIDVTDGSATDPDDGGSEDPPLQFVDTAFRFYANGNNVDVTPVKTQIAGKASTVVPGNQALTLRAVQTNTDTGACTAALTGTQAINIGYECNNPAACSASDQLVFSGAETKIVNRNDDGASLSYSPVNMSFDSNGVAPFSFIYNDAGKITLHAQKTVAASTPDPAFTLTGSSNSFVSRPFGFNLDFSGMRAADWLDNGSLDGSGGDDSYAEDHNGSAYVAAGSDFTMQLSAVTWASEDDADNDGLPDSGSDLTDNPVTSNFGNETFAQTVSISHSLILPAGEQSGNLTAPLIDTGGSSSSFSAGTANATLSWDEVGIISVTAVLNDYLADTSADIYGSAANVGRFYPADFTVSVDSDGTFTNACSGNFSYTGQSFGYLSTPQLRVVPVNTSGTPTQNYIGDFDRLGTVAINAPLQDTSQFGNDGSTLMQISAALSAGTFADDSANPWEKIYTLSASDTFVYDKDSNARIDEFSADIDLVIASVTDGDASASGLPTIEPVANQIRFGRLRLENTYGSELEDLVMPVKAEYWNGSRWLLNSADECTTLHAGATSLASYTDNLDAGETDAEVEGSASGSATLVNGTSSALTLTAPGLNNEGSVVLAILAGQLDDWLEFDWDNDPGTDNTPSASARFGHYRGHDRIIYWREVSN